MPNQAIFRRTITEWANEIAKNDTTVDQAELNRQLKTAFEQPMFSDLRTLASGDYTQEEIVKTGLPDSVVQGLKNNASVYIQQKQEALDYLASQSANMNPVQHDTAMNRINQTMDVSHIGKITENIMSRTRDMEVVYRDEKAIPIEPSRNRQFDWKPPEQAVMTSYRRGEHGRNEPQQYTTTQLVNNVLGKQGDRSGFVQIGSTTDKFGIPVMRFAKREWTKDEQGKSNLQAPNTDDPGKVGYYDLAYEGSTGAFLWGKANSNTRHTINESLTASLEGDDFSQSLKIGDRRGTANNFGAILGYTNTSGTNYGDNKEKGSGALFNVTTGTYDQLSDLSSQVAIPKTISRGDDEYPYQVTAEDAARMAKHLSVRGDVFTPIDDAKTFVRNQAKRIGSSMNSVTVETSGGSETMKLLVSKGKDNQRAGYRGGSGGVGPTTGMTYLDPAADDDGLFTSRVTRMGRPFERQQRFMGGFSGDRVGFGEGETKVKHGESMITALKSVPLDGYTMDNLPFQTGDLYTAGGKTPNKVMEGSRLAGSLEKGGRIPGFANWQAGNAQEVRVQNVEWDEETQRPIAHFAVGNTADIGEIKPTPGLKGSNVGVWNDQHFNALEQMSGLTTRLNFKLFIKLFVSITKPFITISQHI